MNSNSFSNEELSINDIEKYYFSSANALRAYYTETNKVFLFYSRDKLNEELGEQLQELDRSCSFLLLASIEAQFRIDYLKRCYEKRKDNLSREFRKFSKRLKRPHDARLDDLLEMWKQYNPDKKQLISDLKGAILYRHWLAHGRYWKPNFGKQYDYLSIYTLAWEVEKLLPT